MKKPGVKSRRELARMKKEAEWRQVQEIRYLAQRLQARARALCFDMEQFYRSLNLSNFEYWHLIQKQLHRTGERMYFNRHFYPEMMIQELEYALQDLYQVEELHRSKYQEFLDDNTEDKTTTNKTEKI